MHVQFSKLIQSMCIKKETTNKMGNLMVMILKYLETPQFLRKRLFPKMNDLKFAGVLQPLKNCKPCNTCKFKKDQTRRH